MRNSNVNINKYQIPSNIKDPETFYTTKMYSIPSSVPDIKHADQTDQLPIPSTPVFMKTFFHFANISQNSS